MDNNLTELYMKFFCEHLKKRAPEWMGRGEIHYGAQVKRAREKGDAKTVMHITGDCPRSLSFRMADIIRFHRERLWHAPVFIIPRKGEGIYFEDDIAVGSNVGIGSLAGETAFAVSIFLEKYLKRE